MTKRIISATLATVLLFTLALGAVSCSAFIEISSPLLADGILVKTDNFELTGKDIRAAVWSDYFKYQNSVYIYSILNNHTIAPNQSEFLKLTVKQIREIISIQFSLGNLTITQSGSGEGIVGNSFWPSKPSYDSSYGNDYYVSGSSSRMTFDGSFSSSNGNSLISSSAAALSFSLLDKYYGDDSVTYGEAVLVVIKQMIAKCEYARESGIERTSSIDALINAELSMLERDMASTASGDFNEYIDKYFGGTDLDSLKHFLDIYFYAEAAEDKIYEEFLSTLDSDKLSEIIMELTEGRELMDYYCFKLDTQISDVLRSEISACYDFDEYYAQYVSTAERIAAEIMEADSESKMWTAYKEYLWYYSRLTMLSYAYSVTHYYLGFSFSEAQDVLDDYFTALDSAVEAYLSGDYAHTVPDVEHELRETFEKAYNLTVVKLFETINSSFVYADSRSLTNTNVEEEVLNSWLYDESRDAGDSEIFTTNESPDNDSYQSYIVFRVVAIKDVYTVNEHPLIDYSIISCKQKGVEFGGYGGGLIYGGDGSTSAVYNPLSLDESLKSISNLYDKAQGMELDELVEYVSNSEFKLELKSTGLSTGSYAADKWLREDGRESGDMKIVIDELGASIIIFHENKGPATEYEAKRVLFYEHLAAALEEFYTKNNFFVNSLLESES